MSAFFIWAKEHFLYVESVKTSANYNERAKIRNQLASEWCGMSPEERQPWVERAIATAAESNKYCADEFYRRHCEGLDRMEQKAVGTNRMASSSSEDDLNPEIMVVDEKVGIVKMSGEDEENEMEEGEDNDQSGGRDSSILGWKSFRQLKWQQSLCSSQPSSANGRLNLSQRVAQQQTKLQQNGTKQGKRICGLSKGTSQAQTSSLAQQSPLISTSVSTRKEGAKRILSAQPKLNVKSQSGYILFSLEARKRVKKENPGVNFSDMMKMVGNQWNGLSNERKLHYLNLAEERAKAAPLMSTRKLPRRKLQQPGQIQVFCCRWRICDFQFDSQEALICDFQFDSQEGLYEHVRNAHASKNVDCDNQFVCLWNSCRRHRWGRKPFLLLHRLHRHIREKHTGTSFQFMFPIQRSKNFFIYNSSQNIPLQSKESTSSKIAQPRECGPFAHQPLGNVPATPNPVPSSMATPLTSITTPLNASFEPGAHGTGGAYQPTSGTSSSRFVKTYISSKSGCASGLFANMSLAPVLGYNSKCSATTQHHFVHQQQQIHQNDRTEASDIITRSIFASVGMTDYSTQKEKEMVKFAVQKILDNVNLSDLKKSIQTEEDEIIIVDEQLQQQLPQMSQPKVARAQKGPLPAAPNRIGEEGPIELGEWIARIADDLQLRMVRSGENLILFPPKLSSTRSLLLIPIEPKYLIFNEFLGDHLQASFTWQVLGPLDQLGWAIRGRCHHMFYYSPEEGTGLRRD